MVNEQAKEGEGVKITVKKGCPILSVGNVSVIFPSRTTVPQPILTSRVVPCHEGLRHLPQGRFFRGTRISDILILLWLLHGTRSCTF